MIDQSVEPRLMSYLFSKASEQKIPLSGAFELSPLCNMDCKMCYVKMTQEEMDEVGVARTLEDWLEIARQAKKMGTLYLLITGGEPFLQPYFKELYLELRKMGFIIAINTNGTMIGEEEVKWLVESPPTRINITLYGASNETYERLCNNPIGFSKVTGAIDMLRDAGLSVKLNATMTPYNIDDFEEMMKFAKEHEVKINPTTYMFPPLRREREKIGEGFRLPAKEAGEQMARFDTYRYSEEHFLERMHRMKEEAPVEVEGMMEDEFVQGEGMRCRAGKSTFWLTWDGRMTACGIMNEPVADPFETSFQDAWESIVEQTEKIRLPKTCVTCDKKEVCQNCAAMNMTETEGFEQEPKYVCEMIENYKLETIRLGEMMEGEAK